MNTFSTTFSKRFRHLAFCIHFPCLKNQQTKIWFHDFSVFHDRRDTHFGHLSSLFSPSLLLLSPSHRLDQRPKPRGSLRGPLRSRRRSVSAIRTGCPRSPAWCARPSSPRAPRSAATAPCVTAPIMISGGHRLPPRRQVCFHLYSFDLNLFLYVYRFRY